MRRQGLSDEWLAVNFLVMTRPAVVQRYLVPPCADRIQFPPTDSCPDVLPGRQFGSVGRRRYILVHGGRYSRSGRGPAPAMDRSRSIALELADD